MPGIAVGAKFRMLGESHNALQTGIQIRMETSALRGQHAPTVCRVCRTIVQAFYDTLTHEQTGGREGRDRQVKGVSVRVKKGPRVIPANEPLNQVGFREELYRAACLQPETKNELTRRRTRSRLWTELAGALAGTLGSKQKQRSLGKTTQEPIGNAAT